MRWLRRLVRIRLAKRGCEAGVTGLETAIMCALLSIVTIGSLTSLNSATEAAQFASDRNESLDQLRVMAANFTKDVQQATEATSIDSVTFSSVTMNTYVG